MKRYKFYEFLLKLLFVATLIAVTIYNIMATDLSVVKIVNVVAICVWAVFFVLAVINTYKSKAKAKQLAKETSN